MNFRRQVDKPVRQHLPANESSACSSSLVIGFSFCRVKPGSGGTVGKLTVLFILGRYLLIPRLLTISPNYMTTEFPFTDGNDHGTDELQASSSTCSSGALRVTPLGHDTREEATEL